MTPMPLSPAFASAGHVDLSQNPLTTNTSVRDRRDAVDCSRCLAARNRTSANTPSDQASPTAERGGLLPLFSARGLNSY